MNAPLTSVPKVVRDMILKVQQMHSIQHPDMVLVDVLAEVSASAGKGLTAVGIKKKRVKPNLQMVKFGDAGAGKSDSLGNVHAAMKSFEANKQGYWREKILGDALAEVDILETEINSIRGDKKMTREQKKAKLSQLRTDLLDQEARTHMPELYLDKITPEAVRERLYYNGECVYSVSQEAKGITTVILDGKFNNGNEDSSEFRSGYSWDEIKSSLKKDHTKTIREACITCNWSMTTGDGRKLIALREFQESGMASRFLYLMDKSVKQEVIDDDDDEDDESFAVGDSVDEAWTALIWELLKEYRYGRPRQVKYEKEAKRKMVQYHNELVRKEVGVWRDIKDFITRCQENAWRLTLVVHLMKWGNKAHIHVIDMESVEAGIELSKFFIAQALSILEVHRESKSTSDWKKITTLAKEMNGGFKIRDAVRARADIKLGADQGEIADKLQAFVDAGPGFPRLIQVTVKKGESPWYIPFEQPLLKAFYRSHNLFNPHCVGSNNDGRRAA